MLLVIGGAFQGKLDTASHLSGIPKEKFLDGRSCPFEEVFSGSGIHHFEEYIRRWIKEGKNTEELMERLKKENPGIVVVMREVGYGIVPMDAFERDFRERTGRVGCELARTAGKVVRVICGIGTVIKND